MENIKDFVLHNVSDLTAVFAIIISVIALVFNFISNSKNEANRKDDLETAKINREDDLKNAETNREEDRRIAAVQWSESKTIDYKNLNKQNLNLTRSAILKMYANYMYIYYLKKFEYFICKDYSIANNETCINIEQINKNLLVKLKAEYFYDKEITKKIYELEQIDIVTDLNKIPLALTELILEFSISLTELNDVRHDSHNQCVKHVYNDFQVPGFNDKHIEYLIFAIYQKQLVTKESSLWNIYEIQSEYKKNGYQEIARSESIYVEINRMLTDPSYNKEWVNTLDFYNLLGKKLSEQTAFMPIPNTSDFAIPYI